MLVHSMLAVLDPLTDQCGVRNVSLLNIAYYLSELHQGRFIENRGITGKAPLAK